MNRREFIGIGGGAFAAWAMGGCATSAVGDEYSVTVLGDMHYDASPKERFHAKALKYWQEKGYKHPARLKEFERNARMWQDICRDILDNLMRWHGLRIHMLDRDFTKGITMGAVKG